MSRLIAFCLLLASVGCAGTMKPGAGAPDQGGIPDDRIGLSKTRILDAAAPDPVQDNTTDPGELPPGPRVYPGAPPTIPHGVAELVPITPDWNSCIDCHKVEDKAEGEPTPIPPSHYTDLRNAPGQLGGEVVGARYRCTTCHVPQTGARPLVGNRFNGSEAD